MISRYVIRSEDGIKWATFLDEKKAQEWLSIANRGICRRLGWKGEHFSLETERTEHHESRSWYF